MTLRRFVHFYTLLGALAAGWAALTSGCFDPSTPPCAFTCTSESPACPEHYACGGDGRCHRLVEDSLAACGDEDAATATDVAGTGGASP